MSVIVHQKNVAILRSIKIFPDYRRTINPSDCVDMDCDGLKKVMIKDLDGSFVGQKGAVISQSEYEWDGDRRRGLGDYRIPKEMLTAPDGTRLNVSVIAPNKGMCLGFFRGAL